MNQNPITVDFRRKKIFKNFVKTDRSVINNFSSHRPRPEKPDLIETLTKQMKLELKFCP